MNDNDNKRTCFTKVKKIVVCPLLIALSIVMMVSSLAACSKSSAGETTIKSTPPAKESPVVTQASGKIYLYGESHGVAKILDKEYELWFKYYHDEGMRHLFVEMSYFTAEYLNLWMQSDNDDILEEIYDDWEGTFGYDRYFKVFLQKIKRECPETLFHGTDIGHQYDTTGKSFLAYLEAHDLTGSEKYTLTKEAIQQGKSYYSKNDNVYRENKMTENFIREYDKLGSESIMGIYGAAHTGLNQMDMLTQSVPSMANQLQNHYGSKIYSSDLTWIAKDIEPSRVDHISIRGKEYTASYFGKVDLNGFKDYDYWESWRVENAYDDVKDLPLGDNVITYDSYPMLIETGQVFLISYTKTDGSIRKEYHLSNGRSYKGMPATKQFKVN